MKRKDWSLLLIAAFLFTIFLITHQEKKHIQESITYFPIDHSAGFTTSATTLALQDQIFLWSTSSTSQRPLYLRQDLSFLFHNGVLASKESSWDQETTTIKQQRSYTKPTPGLYESITDHYGEVHSSSSRFASVQQMSQASLYIQNKAGTLAAFTTANDRQEQQFKEQSDEKKARFLSETWASLYRIFHIRSADYDRLPLTALASYNHQALFGYSKKESAAIIGKLWEGLYKNYYLGVRSANGTLVSPLGSSEPLLLFSKDRTHILIIFQLYNHEPISLLQYTR
ncbi:hypothetical protein A374_10490 [Fictibacillus macauensis ZFHKF-1]|uniref:Uncharacterized protein n=1 Tax=Fictibacillus macauensis ZFHKF-1 TaxID=1196324 RepID=I8AI76_9BACL|nr:hypothetical protein [Fictibacillus macauensis]EIT85164.1 hypothetical protein A374_10490 [Fictibacillus macauensis ZFHKF-1]